MAWQLVVHENRDVAEQATKAIYRALGDEVAHVIRESDFENALRIIKDPQIMISLVVLGSSVPATPSSSGNPSGARAACDFIRAVRSIDKTTPIIAMAAADEPALAEVLRVWEDTTALINYNWTTLEQSVKALQYAVQLQSTLELEITLDDDYQGAWRVERGGRLAWREGGPLSIKPSEFETLVRKSVRVRDAGAQWQESMDEVGELLEELLFERNRNKLATTFFKHRAAVGGTENVRIFFTMSASPQQAMFEALRERPRTDFWMLKAPMVRRSNYGDERRPLFADDVSRRGEVNCLIVSANPEAGAFADGKTNRQFEPLPEIRREAEAIKAVLEDARDKGVGIGKVEHLPLQRSAGDIEQIMLSALKREPWHIIHFAGHGFVTSAGKPALVLDATTGAVLPFKQLADALRQTQFVFVSSCRSADQAFLTQAIESVMPAILGYRWPVGDEQAAMFAESFYKLLFTKGTAAFKSLDYAFVAARRAAYSLKEDDNTWASPLLLTQRQAINSGG